MAIHKLNSDVLFFKELSRDLEGSKGKFHYCKTDVTIEEDVVAAFSMVNREIGGVDVLVNSAGVGYTTLVKGWCACFLTVCYMQKRFHITLM